MERKYQIFVSSTFDDLKEERRQVINALLELGCIPIGMELFPAAGDDQWTYIKRVIDECDYYLLISAGRYGSCSDNGEGYTEMEYKYALKAKKPVVPFLHRDINSIVSNKTDQDSDKKQKLFDFREHVKKEKLCKFWESPFELKANVATSISKVIKDSPAIGWVRADKRFFIVTEDVSISVESKKRWNGHWNGQGTDIVLKSDDFDKDTNLNNTLSLKFNIELTQIFEIVGHVEFKMDDIDYLGEFNGRGTIHKGENYALINFKVLVKGGEYGVKNFSGYGVGILHISGTGNEIKGYLLSLRDHIESKSKMALIRIGLKKQY